MLDYKDLGTFNSFLRNCAEERIKSLHEILTSTQGYQNLDKEKHKYYTQIKNTMTDELIAALNNYNEKENQMDGVEQAFFYEQGFLDALKLFKILLFYDEQ